MPNMAFLDVPLNMFFISISKIVADTGFKKWLNVTFVG